MMGYPKDFSKEQRDYSDMIIRARTGANVTTKTRWVSMVYTRGEIRFKAAIYNKGKTIYAGTRDTEEEAKNLIDEWFADNADLKLGDSNVER